MSQTGEASPAADLSAVSFYFDPACPWTWNTSRWLVEVAGEQAFGVTWRSFSLAVANEGRDVPEQYRAGMEAARAALRALEALRSDGRNDDIGRFYTELGRRWHHDDEARSVETVEKALATVGLSELSRALADTSWDEALRASHAEAQALVGTDVGSPVVRLGDRALFGPIVSPPPTGAAALSLWTTVATLVAADGFFELKRSRTGPPVPGPRP